MSKNKFYVGIKNEASTNTLELYFTDYIYNTWDWDTWEEQNMVQDTINQIKAANPTKIKCIINSLGGDVMIGLAIRNYLAGLSIPVETQNIGFAASIASVMMTAGSKRTMARNAFQILHAASSGTWGNAKDLRQAAEALDTVSNQLADCYAQVTGGKHDAKYFTDRWASGDWWLTAQECLELGLITEITNAVEISASVDPAQYGFKNIPAAVIHASAGNQQTIFQSIREEMGKFKDTLLAAITGSKEDKNTDKIANKQDILDLVNSVLTPFAEKLDEAVKEVAPEKSNNEGAPAAPPAPATPLADGTVPGEPSEGERAAEDANQPSAEATALAELKAEFETFKTQMANASTKPQSGRSEGSAAASKMEVEYQ